MNQQNTSNSGDEKRVSSAQAGLGSGPLTKGGLSKPIATAGPSAFSSRLMCATARPSRPAELGVRNFSTEANGTGGVLGPRTRAPPPIAPAAFT